MKKYWTKNKVLFIVIVALIAAIIPFIINWAYKKGGYVTVWDGSDLLAFYGNILTAAAAVLGVYYTLDYSKFKQMEYEKLRVKPYIYNDATIIVPINDDFISTCKADQIYIYKSLHSGLTEKSEGELPPRIKLINQKDSGFDKKYFINNSIILDMTLKNLGAESAVKIKFYMNNKISSNTFSLAKEEYKNAKLVIYFGDIDKSKNLTTVENMKVVYENIYGNQLYEQTGDFKLEFNVEKDYNRFSIGDDFFEIQREINN